MYKAQAIVWIVLTSVAVSLSAQSLVGPKILYSAHDGTDYEVYSAEVIGVSPIQLGSAVQLTDNSFEDTVPTWSPDGSKIAFSTDRDGNSEIYVMDASGANQVNVTNHSATDQQPAWSPVAAEIAFISDRVNGTNVWDIHILSLDGGGNPIGDPVEVPNLVRDGWPGWSPDGSQGNYSATGAAGMKGFPSKAS